MECGTSATVPQAAAFQMAMLCCYPIAHLTAQPATNPILIPASHFQPRTGTATKPGTTPTATPAHPAQAQAPLAPSRPAQQEV